MRALETGSGRLVTTDAGERALDYVREDPYLAACRRVLLETIGVGLYFAMRRGRCRAHGMCLMFILLVWFVIRQCARVTWLLSCLGFAVSLALLLGPCAIAYYVTQIIGFVALAVVDSTSLALIRPLIACIDLVAATVTATTRRSVATSRHPFVPDRCPRPPCKLGDHAQ